MGEAVLTINSRNYGAWSMRAWLICRLSGLRFSERVTDADDPSTRAELLQLSPSFLVPSLRVAGFEVWDTLAIAESLHELRPEAGLLPGAAAARAHCRAVSAELHSGFPSLRSALPMNIKRTYRDFKIWPGAEADIDRIARVWTDCLSRYGGPWLFGPQPTLADAMFAPECTRFRTYGVTLPADLLGYVDRVLAQTDVACWVEQALSEPDALVDLEGDF